MPRPASRRLLQRYRAKITNSSSAGSSVRLPFRHKMVSIAAPQSIKTALGANCRSTAEGVHSTEMPKISPRLAVTEPTALPTARSISPLSTPVTETVSSGSVVATDTTVAPTIKCGMPEVSAIHTAPSKNQSPPLTISKSPTENSNTMTNRFTARPSLPAPRRRRVLSIRICGFRLKYHS
ncbi:hypothetical protein SDC9_96993 [bioreactor metagenome]|uniref:Uncharacterized protein n=1 Tax=bioreactor metagenome TaxID=1076179 RepID=A0A645AB67_9ZZZZ